MHRPALLRTAALVTAALGVASTLVPPPAQALPVFSQSEVVAEGLLINDSSVSCTRVFNTTPSQVLPVAENGPGTVSSNSITGSMTRNGDPSDVLSMAAHIDATSSVASLGGNPRTFSVTATGSVAVSTTKSTSLCNAEILSRVGLLYAFKVSQAGFLTLTTTASGDMRIRASLEDDVNEERFVTLGAVGSKLEGPIKVFLPPGSYKGDFEAGASASTSVALGPTTVSGTIRGDFTVAGSQLAVQPGKAGKYVVLPSARTCAAHLLLAAVTDKKKRVRQVKQVTFFVNGSRVKTVRTPDRGAQVSLPVADDVRADVLSEFVLFPARRGRPAKHLVATASYEACS
jgi:hypothetical protein